MKTPFAGNSYRVTSPFGNRTLNGVAAMHNGIDLVSMGSWDIAAVSAGQVVVSQIVTDKANRAWEWGNYVCVYGDDKRFYYYCHMASRTVQTGQRVAVGDKLGVMGSTGYSFGAHLHFEVRESDGKTKLNPADILGIPNAVGVYTVDEFEKALNVLVGVGIINTPEYWRIHRNDIKYIDTLIINIANKVAINHKSSAKQHISSADAIVYLHKAGVMNTPEYWVMNIDKVQFLDLLIQRSALILGA